ncbi:DUF2207 domain-containing protein [Agromyces sp. Marseille-P2726]|uniref:DUF2207 family protein n=1 Tax=Agromyces sp. Marseille-P2726 TaxID=2709132 RepID=UPI0015706AAD
MLTAAIVLAVVPAFIILGLGITARGFAARRVIPSVVHDAPEKGSTILRDAVLVDADRRAASAALIDLAVKRKVRLSSDGSRRDPIRVELVPGAVLTTDELALLEALFSPERAPGRARRFSVDGRALTGRLRTLVQHTEDALAREGLVDERRVTWPSVTLMVLAYLGMFVEALLIVFTLFAADWPALIATLLALAATVAAILVTPSSWRRFLPPARPRREHLEGLRQYLSLAAGDRLHVLESASDTGPTSVDAAVDLDVHTEASALVARFHLHERLLPYAVLFGLEREWLVQLQRERATLRARGFDVAGDDGHVTATVARALESAGAARELPAAVGDLVDADGDVLDGVDGSFEVFSS